MRQTLSGLLLLVSLSAGAQKPDLIDQYSKFIDSADLRKHLTVLASDAYEGRETGKNGQRMAAEYIRKSFEEDGCAMAPKMDSYEQSFQVVESVPGGDLSLFGKALQFKTDFIYYGAKQLQQYENLPVYTVEDFELQPLENAVVIHPLEDLGIRTKIDELKRRAKGAKAIIFVTSNYDDIYEYLGHYTTGKTMRLKTENEAVETPVFFVRADALKGALKKPFTYLLGTGKKKSRKEALSAGKMSGSINKEENELTSSNVIGFIQGSDPRLSQEVVIITAHYDHIGIDNGVVYNGADDDGTGTVGLLEIAEAFMAARKDGNGPRRSVLIMTVSGEEKGLLGSTYYVEHPVLPLRQTIADLNIDMIGRNDIAHTTDDYIYIIGSNMISNDLHDANEEANKEYTKLVLDYKFNSKNDPNQFYYRSDHYNFAKNDIPSIFYFSGIHDDYHQPTDDIEKINFAKVEKVSRLVFATAWKLANDAKRPRMNY